MTNHGFMNSAVRAIHERELTFMMRMTNSGIAVAIPAALHYCREHNCPVPDWLSKAASELLCELLRSEKPSRRGRTATHIARHRQDCIDFTRWSTVLWQREAQTELLDQLESIRGQPSDIPDWYRKDREKLQEWLGTSFDRAFECAAMVLEGTSAYGSPDAMKRSYFIVQRTRKNPEKGVKYYQLDTHFLAELGIIWEPFVRPGRKLEPLYEIALKR